MTSERHPTERGLLERITTSPKARKRWRTAYTTALELALIVLVALADSTPVAIIAAALLLSRRGANVVVIGARRR